MTDLNKTKLATGKSKLDLIRSMPLTPASPLAHTQPTQSETKDAVADIQPDAQPSPASSIPIPHSTKPDKAKASETTRQDSHQSSARRPTTPIGTPGRFHMEDKKHLANHAFTFAFSARHYALAQHLASVIGCKLDDIITRIARSFQTDQLDTATEIIEPRLGSGKRILLKIDQNTIDVVRAKRDPLGVRSDGFLLRAPVIAALDRIADQVLEQLKGHYDK